MKLLICTVIAIFYGASASPLADQYIHSVLYSALPSQLRTLKLNPAPLSNFSTEFYGYEFGVRLNGKVNYTRGSLVGLADVQRFSSCGGPSYKFGVPTINCTIGFSNLRTSHVGKLKYGQTPVASVQAKANTTTTTTVFIEVSSPSPSQRPTLSTFRFVQVGQMNSTITGLSISVSKFRKNLENGYRTHVGGEIMNIISQSFRYALSLAVSQVPMPR